MPPFGELALYFSLATSLLLMLLPTIGVYANNTKLMRSAKPLTTWLFILVLIAFLALGYSFYTNDFSFSYVFMNSNTRLPAIYRFTALWAGHEGSMLLWVLTLTLWMFISIFFTKKVPIEITSTMLAILGAISAAFISFVLFTSNPFDRLIYPPIFDGRDLNPLLQDIGLIIHPPLLYMGYVGFAIPYAFSCALLITGFIDRFTIRWIRPWVLASWAFLTIGIAVGSWWAYYELGWGGWWFWDPVENASLIPWILSTALLHSLIATEKRQAFSIWSILLAILCFILSVLGTFLVRSGILTSVHSFASDPRRGAVILVILATVLIFGVGLLLFRSSRIRQVASASLVSKESGILLNNIFLSVICFIVVLGTLYPLIMDILNLGKISVGANYFNSYVNPIAMILLIILGITPLLKYKKDHLKRLRKIMIGMLVGSVALGTLGNILYTRIFHPSTALLNIVVTFTLILCFWVILGIIMELYLHKPKQMSFIRAIFNQSASRWGMNLGHFGLVVTIIGITMTSYYSSEEDRLLSVGKTESVQGYEFKLIKLEDYNGPNYLATKGIFEVSYNGKFLRLMMPEKRIYLASGMQMSEVALRPSLLDDLYIALAEKRAEGIWAIRLYVKPFVRWIWLGGIIMAFAAVISIFGIRPRKSLEEVR